MILCAKEVVWWKHKQLCATAKHTPGGSVVETLTILCAKEVMWWKHKRLCALSTPLEVVWWKH